MGVVACAGDRATNAPSESDIKAGSSSGSTGTGSSGAKSGTSANGTIVDTSAQGPLTPLQKRKAEMLTSIWENSTAVLQYAYCENIDDGRGYTAGRAGFCSGTGDAVLVVRCLDQATSGQNPMHKYLGELTALETRFNDTGEDQDKTSGLDRAGSYCRDWTASISGATAAAFKSCQDKIVDQLYFGPALAQAVKWGVTRPLTIAALYDADINHGDDGVADLVKAANTDVGNGKQVPPGAPLTQAQESAWLDAFLLRRLTLLKSDATWAESVDRVAVYEALRAQNNWDLSQPIVTSAKAKNLYPGKGYKDSGYPKCTIAVDGSLSGDPSCTSPTGE